MDLSLRRVGSENMHYHESGEDSEIQLVFLPGGLNPGIWKHQINYFSRKYRVITFRPTKSFRHREGEKKALENILNQEQIKNAVIVTGMWGGDLAQKFENREEVKATVFSSALSNTPEISKTSYRFLWKLGARNPKILKKALFSSDSSYSVVKEFADEIDLPEFRDLESFTGRSIRGPEKPALILNAEEDRYSSIEVARALGGSSSVSVIERAGSFCFYEKPQEYNKALNDFLTRLEKAIEEKKIMEKKDRNRTLLEFENRSEKMGKRKKLVKKTK